MTGPTRQKNQLELIIEQMEAPHPSIEDIPIQWFLNLLTNALIVLALVVGALIYFFGLMTTAKIIVSCIFFGTALVCLGVAFKAKEIIATLHEIEQIGYLIQEEAMFACMQARQGLSMVQMKLAEATNPRERSFMPELMKHAGPLVTLLLKKEQSKMSWLMFGFKLAKSAAEVLKQKL